MTGLKWDLGVSVGSIPGKYSGVRGTAQPSCKVRIHLRTKEQPKKSCIFVNTLFLRIAGKELFPLTSVALFPQSSACESSAIDPLMTLIPIREQGKCSLGRLYEIGKRTLTIIARNFLSV